VGDTLDRSENQTVNRSKMTKPLPSVPHPKPKRLPERRAVTIVAGVRSLSGIVLCADTQETVSQLSKRHVPKLRFEPTISGINLVNKPEHLAAAFCGAGDGPWIDKLVDECWKHAKGATSLGDACSKIEDAIKNLYAEFGAIFQPGFCPTAELIYGVKMHGNSRLFSASGPIVTEQEQYASAGCGYYMADFLKTRMHHNFLTIYQCTILAAYILFQAKEHVDGCGGDSHIAVLRNRATSGRVPWRKIQAITDLLKESDGLTGLMILKAADFSIETEELKKELESLLSTMQFLRDRHHDNLKQLEATWVGAEKALSGAGQKYDSLGLPVLAEESSERPGSN